MPAIFAPIAVFLAAILRPMAGRILTFLGLSVVTFSGMSLAVDQIVQAVQQRFGSIAGDMAAIVSLLGLDIAAGMILSAHVSALAIKMGCNALNPVKRVGATPGC